MRKRFPIIMVVLIFTVLLAGCQPTPDTPVVVQKDMQQMIEKGMATEAPSQATPSQTQSPAPTTYEELCAAYGVPERFKTNLTEGNLTINCDVAIELPGQATLPMAKVEAGRFSQEQVYTFIKALCGATPVYLRPLQQDKEYCEKQILKTQQRIAEETDKDLIDSLNDSLADMKEQYKSAPEHVELVPADGTLEMMEVQDNTDTISGRFTTFYANSVPFEENGMMFSVLNDPLYESDGVNTYLDEDGNTQIIAPSSGSRLWFEREGNSSKYGGGFPGRALANVTQLSLSGGAADNCMLSTKPQQARKTVEELLKRTGIDDMVIDTVSLYSNKNEPLPPEMIEQMKQAGRPYRESTKQETQAYVFRLLRRVGGVNVESVSGWESQSSVEGMDVGKEWDYEWLSIAVDDGGITNVYWHAPLAVTEIMTEDTAIRPWSEIEEIFGKMIMIENAYNINTDGITTTIDITRASLSLRRIMERDSYTTGLLVPVWNFFGTSTSRKDGEDAHTTDYDEYPLMTINAIDGSVIDIGKGY